MDTRTFSEVTLGAMDMSQAETDANHAHTHDLPKQADFIAHGIVRSSGKTANPPPGESCGICLDEFETRIEATNMTADDDTVVYLKPCTHFYHRRCIVTWLTSIRPESASCPMCRKILFVADPLTAAQIASLDTENHLLGLERLPDGPHREPRTGEEVVDWTSYTLHRACVRLLAYEATFEHREISLIDVCQFVMGSLLVEAGRPLRAVFAQTQDTFIPLYCASHLIFWLSAYYPETLRTRACKKWPRPSAIVHMSPPLNRFSSSIVGWRVDSNH